MIRELAAITALAGATWTLAVGGFQTAHGPRLPPACVLTFADTGKHFVDPYHTPNATLEVTYWTAGCTGAPRFTWTGGGGFSVFPIGQPAPTVFLASLVAEMPGGPYVVTAQDGEGHGSVTISVFIEEEIQ